MINCPLCGNDKTYWLRGAIVVSARRCSCGCVFDNEDEYTEQEVKDFKKDYPDSYLIGKSFIFYVENLK